MITTPSWCVLKRGARNLQAASSFFSPYAHARIAFSLIHYQETHPRAPFPQLSVRSLFIRGGVVRYVQLPPEAVDTDLLQDASRKEAVEAAKGKR